MARLILLAFVAILVCGCTSRHKSSDVPAGPPYTVTVSHFPGRLLSPTTRPSAIEADALSPVSLELIVIPRVPRNVMKPIGGNSRLVTSVGTDAALLSVPDSLSKARVDSGPDAQWMQREASAGTFGQPTSLGSFKGVLGPDICLVAALTEPGHPRPSLQITLYQPANTPQVLQVGLTRRSASTTETTTIETPAEQLETTVTTIDLSSSESYGAVLVPMSSGGVFAYLSIGPKGSAISDQTLAQVNKDLAAATSQPTAVSAEQLMIQSTLAAIQKPETRRPAIVQLTNMAQAHLAQDVAVSADEKSLEAFAKTLAEVLPKSPPGQLAWTLDRAAFNLLAHMRIQGKLPAELDTVLTVHAGEAGHSVVSLEQLADRVATPKDLENRLVAENFIYLEEVSPSSRVRAYDWLKARNMAPANYDPLGPINQRRRALDAAMDAMAGNANSNATTGPSGGPPSIAPASKPTEPVGDPVNAGNSSASVKGGNSK